MSMFNVDFQKSILKLLCVNLKFAHEYGALLKPDYFDSQPHRILLELIYNHIITYNKELTQSDLLVLADEYVLARGFTSEVFLMLKEEIKSIDKVHIQSEQFIIDKLTNYCRQQELKNAIIKSVDIMEKGGGTEEVLKLIDQANSVGYGIDDGMTFQDLLTFPSIYRDRYNPTKIIKTGFHRYDEALSGGMAPGEVHILVAPPKTGKSTLACNMGVMPLVSGKNVFHISMELKAVDIMAKYATRMTGMTYSEILTKPDAEFTNKIERFNKYKPNLFVNYWTEKTASALTMRAWISRIRAKTGKSPDLIIVDYDDCMLPISGGSSDMYEDAGEIYTDLIGLADYFKCPLLTLAQPKREAWEKANRGELIYSYDLAHSARKAHKCFSISSVNFAEGKEEGILYVDMVRRGTSSVKIPLYKDLSKGLFQEINK